MKPPELLDNDTSMALGFHDPRRNLLPLKPKQISQYRIERGKIFSEACEVSVVDHCNFSCRSCTHLSPVAHKHNVAPNKVEDDLSCLAQVYHADHVRLLGGEPLLHPRIVEVINAVRRSGISERIRIITNGSLSHLMTPDFWQAADEVHVSIYPNARISSKNIEEMMINARQYNTALVFKRFDIFRESYSEVGSEDHHLIARIYQSCQIAHIWRCHNVSSGFFYRCPESIFIPQVVGKLPVENSNDDRLKIHGGSNFGYELLEFLERKDPLSACSHCLGSVGRPFDHMQAVRSSWRKLQEIRTEDLVDWDFLRKLEDDADAYNGCYVTVNGI